MTGINISLFTKPDLKIYKIYFRKYEESTDWRRRMQKAGSLEKPLMLGKIEGRRGVGNSG